MLRKVAACIEVFEQLLIGANIDTAERTTRKGIRLIGCRANVASCLICAWL